MYADCPLFPAFKAGYNLFTPPVPKLQISYLQDKLPQREKQHERLEKLEKAFLYFGIATVLLMFAVYLLSDVFHVLPHAHYPFNWHFLVLVSGFLLLLAGFLGKYISITGIAEDIYNFRMMEPAYQKAQTWIKQNPGDTELHKQIVFDLGKKALEENSKWVELHDARRAKPELE